MYSYCIRTCTTFVDSLSGKGDTFFTSSFEKFAKKMKMSKDIRLSENKIIIYKMMVKT